MARLKKTRVVGQKRYNRLLKTLKTVKTAEVRVGHFDEVHPETDGATVADVAAWNALGTDKIPARDFVTPVTDGQRGQITFEQHSILEDISDGRRGVFSGLFEFGQLMVGRIQMSITNLRTPPNAPGTVKRKGSSNPLIDSGFMRQKVEKRIYSKGSRVG